MKTEYNHGGALSNIWQDRNEFRWANRAGEGAESTFELAVQAAGAALTIDAINAPNMTYHDIASCPLLWAEHADDEPFAGTLAERIEYLEVLFHYEAQDNN